MLANLKKKFGNMKAVVPTTENPLQGIYDKKSLSEQAQSRKTGSQSQQSQNQTSALEKVAPLKDQQFLSQ